MRIFVMMLSTRLIWCSTLPAKRAGGLELITALRSCGGTILTTTYGFVEKKPENRIGPEGNTVIPTGIEHPLLAKGHFHNQKTLAPTREHGTGSFSYVQEQRQLTVTQHLDEENPGHWDAIAASQVAFLRRVYPSLRPRFGWIDESGYIEARKALGDGKPRFLFWANVLSPELVEEFGKDFLFAAPGWRTEEFDDGGILYVTEEKFSDWYVKASHEALQYFKRRLPDIKLYRAKPAGLPDEITRIVQTDQRTGVETTVYQRGEKQKKRRRG